MGRHVSEDVVDEMERLYATGLSASQVAKVVGYTCATILIHLNRRGVKIRYNNKEIEPTGELIHVGTLELEPDAYRRYMQIVNYHRLNGCKPLTNCKELGE